MRRKAKRKSERELLKKLLVSFERNDNDEPEAYVFITETEAYRSQAGSSNVDYIADLSHCQMVQLGLCVYDDGDAVPIVDPGVYELTLSRIKQKKTKPCPCGNGVILY